MCESMSSRMKQVFRDIDKDENGYLDKDELRSFLKTETNKLSEEELEHVFEFLDRTHNHKIEYDEFFLYIEKAMTNKLKPSDSTLKMIETATLQQSLRSIIFEYALKNRLNEIVKEIAIKYEQPFDSYKINGLRFTLFYMYILIKDKELIELNKIIFFLEKFVDSFPNVIPSKTSNRVVYSLKRLHFYEIAKNDTTQAISLIDKYFPRTEVCNDIETINKENENRSNAQTRLQCELFCVLSEQQRNEFLNNEYKKLYNQTYFRFLETKVVEIFETLNKYLPLTKIDELIEDNFRNSHGILLDYSDNEQLHYSDELRFNIFIDIIRTQKNNCLECARSLLDLLNNWSLDHISQTNLRAFMDQTSLVRGMLFMDSQIPNDMTKSQISDQTQSKSTDFDTALSNNSSESSRSPDSNALEQLMISDMITDDDRDMSP